jgi:hypothetical protein
MAEPPDPISAVAASLSMSRRALLGSTTAMAAVMILAGTRTGRAQAKMPKQTAQYQDSPKGDQKCEGCRFFIEGGSCRLVEGEISPNGWCRLFQPKA